MSEPKPRPDYDIPHTDKVRRGDLWAEHRARRAKYLHDLLVLVPAEQQPAALACVLEIERVDGEAVRENAGEWQYTVQQAYRTGIVHGADDLSIALGLSPVPLDAPLTYH